MNGPYDYDNRKANLSPMTIETAIQMALTDMQEVVNCGDNPAFCAEMKLAISTIKNHFKQEPTKAVLKVVNPEQYKALLEVKLLLGEFWKSALLQAWINGNDVNLIDDGHLLRQVRNDFGPSWLEKADI